MFELIFNLVSIEKSLLFLNSSVKFRLYYSIYGKLHFPLRKLAWNIQQFNVRWTEKTFTRISVIPSRFFLFIKLFLYLQIERLIHIFHAIRSHDHNK